MSSGQLCALKVIKIKAGEKRERGGERGGRGGEREGGERVIVFINAIL